MRSLCGGDELDHVAAEPVEHGDGEGVGRAKVGERRVVLGADLLPAADLVDVDTDAVGLLQEADLPGKVLALAGDPGVPDAVAGPREEYGVEAGFGAGLPGAAGAACGGDTDAGPDLSEGILP
ncbi:hypothetical protein GCM10023220_68550 [Streptomyces ziwulingensis]|uniref:Uncharacterized protein n=1 Tax=Streptomyces ziwulingensis TaxID=1045501 RepID=A0ABP9D186_9ACTN